MKELILDPALMFVPTMFDRDPIKTAPVRAVMGLAGQNH